MKYIKAITAIPIAIIIAIICVPMIIYYIVAGCYNKESWPTDFLDLDILWS